MLYLDYGTHGPHLFAWHTLDGKSGKTDANFNGLLDPLNGNIFTVGESISSYTMQGMDTRRPCWGRSQDLCRPARAAADKK